MSTTVYYNGEYVSKEALRISPDDRGFLLGDGVYEVARAYGGRLFELQAHLDRLAYSLRETQIRGIDSAGLEGVASELLGRAGLGAGDGIVYVQVTRGSAPRTHYFPPADVSPTVYAYAAPLRAADHSREGIDSITVPDLRWSRCDIKAISLLANCPREPDGPRGWRTRSHPRSRRGGTRGESHELFLRSSTVKFVQPRSRTTYCRE